MKDVKLNEKGYPVRDAYFYMKSNADKQYLNEAMRPETIAQYKRQVRIALDMIEYYLENGGVIDKQFYDNGGQVDYTEDDGWVSGTYVFNILRSLARHEWLDDEGMKRWLTSNSQYDVEESMHTGGFDALVDMASEYEWEYMSSGTFRKIYI